MMDKGYTKSGDLAKLREKNLLKEFQTYLESKGKLKVFRSEAVSGQDSAKLWKDKDYKLPSWQWPSACRSRPFRKTRTCSCTMTSV
jgi:hypothetical protein